MVDAKSRCSTILRLRLTSDLCPEGLAVVDERVKDRDAPAAALALEGGNYEGRMWAGYTGRLGGKEGWMDGRDWERG